MARERAQKGIAARHLGHPEEDRLPPARRRDVGGGDHVVGARHVVPGDGLGVGDERVGEAADAVERAGLREHPVVRHDVGIHEHEGQFFTGLGPQLRRLVGEV
jgi:hypothetical protein